VLAHGDWWSSAAGPDIAPSGGADVGEAEIDGDPVNRRPAERAHHGRCAPGFQAQQESAALKGTPDRRDRMSRREAPDRGGKQRNPGAAR